jgi:hypothetical protein
MQGRKKRLQSLLVDEVRWYGYVGMRLLSVYSEILFGAFLGSYHVTSKARGALSSFSPEVHDSILRA